MKCSDCQKNKFLQITVAKNIKICLKCYLNLLFRTYEAPTIKLNDVNWSKVRNE